jgi:hypothetical protein
MLIETDPDDKGADAYDDEAAREILRGYLPSAGGGGGGGGGTSLDGLDVAGLREGLRTVVAAAEVERKRREQEARRLRSLSSSLSSSLARSGGGGPLPSSGRGGDGAAEEDEEGSSSSSSLAGEEHSEAVAFLAQLVPEGTDREVVAYAFRVKCIGDRERAADLLLGLAGEGGGLAALAEEKVGVVEKGGDDWVLPHDATCRC